LRVIHHRRVAAKVNLRLDSRACLHVVAIDCGPIIHPHVRQRSGWDRCPLALSMSRRTKPRRASWYNVIPAEGRIDDGNESSAQTPSRGRNSHEARNNSAAVISRCKCVCKRPIAFCRTSCHAHWRWLACGGVPGL
jgi:hypothetical protein